MLEEKAKHIRKDIIKILAKKGGHAAKNLSSADIFTALYFTTHRFHPQHISKDRIVVTEQLRPAWHAAMAHSGYFSKKDLQSNTLPEGTYPENTLGIAIGKALASKQQTHCIISDSDFQDGRIWETIAHAGTLKIGNLTLIIDRNNLGAEGFMQIEPFRAKLEAFSWKVIEVDGHNIEHITQILQETRNSQKPTIILAHTIPGKGVSFIENNPQWYERKPTKEEEQKAITELTKTQ